MWTWLVQLLLYGSGVVVYMLRFPEAWFPGKFDYIVRVRRPCPLPSLPPRSACAYVGSVKVPPSVRRSQYDAD
jgi:predicted membrane channel-forming protein YqfA (hemolysin III family)